MNFLVLIDFSCTWMLRVQQKTIVILENLRQELPLESKGETLEWKEPGGGEDGTILYKTPLKSLAEFRTMQAQD